jgi:hypothetical protein
MGRDTPASVSKRETSRSEVDREVPFEHRTIAQVTVEIHTGVVDQDIERLDALDRGLNQCATVCRTAKARQRPIEVSRLGLHRAVGGAGLG